MNQSDSRSQREQFLDFLYLLRQSNFPFPLPTESRQIDEDYDVIVDFENLLNAESHTDELEDSYSNWLNQFDELEVADWVSKNPDGLEALAWYQSISFYQENAGIHLTERGIGFYGALIRRELLNSSGLNQQLNRRAIVAAIEVLLAHELFHHQVEWFCLTLGNSFLFPNTNPYVEYFEKLYKPSRKPISDDLLEESLASAAMIRNLSTKSLEVNFSKQEISKIRRAIRANIPLKPPGYRKGIRFLSPTSFKGGKVSLAASIFHLRLVNTNHINALPTFGISLGEWGPYFRNTWTLEIAKNSGVKNQSVPPFALSLPSKKVKSLLKSEGYSPTDLGKGSHVVWQADGKPSITLPSRRDYEGYDAMKNVANALGLKNLRELENRIKST